jgi:hypothetical protein
MDARHCRKAILDGSWHYSRYYDSDNPADEDRYLCSQCAAIQKEETRQEDQRFRGQMYTIGLVSLAVVGAVVVAIAKCR